MLVCKRAPGPDGALFWSRGVERFWEPLLEKRSCLTFCLQSPSKTLNISFLLYLVSISCWERENSCSYKSHLSEFGVICDFQEPVTAGVPMRTQIHSPSAFRPLNQPLTSLYGRVPRWRKAPSFCLHSPSFFWRTTDLQPSSTRDIPTSRWMFALSIQGQNVAGIRGKWPPLRVL